MPKQLISLAEFARRCGVQRSTVARAKPLEPIIENAKIDAGHPIAKQYLAEKSANPNKKTGRPKKSGMAAEPKRSNRPDNTVRVPESVPGDLPDDYDEDEGDPLDLIPEDIRKLAHWPLKKLVRRFGTDERFKHFLDGLQKIEQIQEKRHKNNVALGSDIPREFVQTHIIGLIDASFSRLVNDTPRSMALQVTDAVQAEQSVGEIEELIRDLIGQHIASLKDNALRRIKKA